MTATRHRGLAALLVLGGALAAGCTTTARMSPDFPAHRAALHRVAVTPPDVLIVRRTFQGEAPVLRDETKAVRARLPGLVASELRERGFEVKEEAVDARRFAGDAELRFRTTQLQDAFLRAQVDLYPVEMMRTREAHRIEVTVGPLVNPFADTAKVDALLVSTLGGLKKSWGESLKDLFVADGGVLRKGAVLRIALVDGDTGEVLWANSVVTKDEDFENKGLKKMVKRAFREFPKER